MSIEELESSYSGRSPGLDRTPPQDVAAEMSVLGGMLLSKDAVADVIEQIRGSDFYRPAHEIVYEAIIDLYGRGEPADAITVVGDVDDIVNNAQAEVYAVTEGRRTEDYLPLSEILGPTFDEIEAAQGRG